MPGVPRPRFQAATRSPAWTVWATRGRLSRATLAARLSTYSSAASLALCLRRSICAVGDDVRLLLRRVRWGLRIPPESDLVRGKSVDAWEGVLRRQVLLALGVDPVQHLVQDILEPCPVAFGVAHLLVSFSSRVADLDSELLGGVSDLLAELGLPGVAPEVLRGSMRLAPAGLEKPPSALCRFLARRTVSFLEGRYWGRRCPGLSPSCLPSSPEDLYLNQPRWRRLGGT